MPSLKDEFVTEAVFAIPEDADAETASYLYDQRILDLLPSFGVNTTMLRLPASNLNPSPQEAEEAFHALEQTPVDKTLLIDGGAFTLLPGEKLARLEHRIVALVHHSLSHEPDLSDEDREKLRANERAIFTRAAHIIATNTTTANVLASEFSIPEHRLTIAEPGTEPALRASGTGTPLQLLCVGSVESDKGYDTLLRALEPLSIFDWRLTIIGALDRDTGAVNSIQELLATTGLDDRVELPGVVVRATLELLYDSTDVFIMPTQCEGDSRVLADAMARGLPIICTSGNGVTDIVPDSAAIKVAPGDKTALSPALEKVLTDRKLRTQLADAAWEAGRLLPTWAETARRIAAVILGLRP